MAMYSNSIHSANEPHPFDPPHDVMKMLKREINELRAAFQAEQQQRAVEVQQLRQEVSVLRDQIPKEKLERQTICHQIVNDLTQLRSDHIKGLDEIKTNFGSSLHQLNQILQDEMRDRRAQDSLRDTREATEKSERISEAAAIKNDIGKHKQVFSGTREDVYTSISNITHDIEMIATALSKASYTKAGLNADGLHCWKYFSGSGMLSTGGGKN
mmetsp:Transcript_81928/g.206790  ORF Transcript_81928/g.206790 Transcript_81928/m.206790 type:complete len:213 (+) Transcript_81928:24-662(+)